MKPSWRDAARCRGMDIDVFFPGRGGRGPGGPVQRAKAICAECTVREPCLLDALSSSVSEDQGIRGGLSQRERKQLRKQPLAAVIDLPVPSEHEQPRRAAA